MTNKPHLSLAQRYWQDLLQPADLAIDMTCGNGHDTLFLANLGAQVIGFDIQEAAIQATRALVPNATLFHCSHDKLEQTPLPCPPKLIVYNLGYLPGGDKAIVTKRSTTMASLQQAIRLIDAGGAISVMCYPGHEEGLKEEQEMVAFVSQLPSLQWSVSHHQWINRLRSPSLIWLTRKWSS